MKWLKDYFDLNSREGKGILLLCAMIIILIGLQYAWPIIIPDRKADFSEVQKLSERVAALNHDSAKKTSDSIVMSEDHRLKPKTYLTTPIDINSADSIQLMTVKGIGPAFAHRILAVRDMLGGFAKKEQLMDVYGIGEERYQGIQGQVVVRPVPLRIIDVNHADYNKLKRNPYIRAHLADVILKHIKNEGPFTSTAELQKITGLDETTFQKLLPYVRIQ